MLDTVKNSLINGIDVGALASVAEAVSQDPSKALVSFKVTTRWMGQTKSQTVVEGYGVAGDQIDRKHVIAADEPLGLLGTDTAPNPQELLMAAFNSCITVGYVAGAAVRGIRLDSLEIVTRGSLDLRGFLGLDDSIPPGYEILSYDVRISGDGTAEAFEAIHQNVIKTSPNYFNLARPVRVDGVLHVD